MDYQKLAHFDTNNLTCHPFIKDTGNHSTLISDNVMSNVIQFFSFKADADEWLETKQKESKPVNLVTFFNDYYSFLSRKKMFENAGIFVNSRKTGVIDHAVELGMELNYEELMQSFKDTIICSMDNKKDDEHIPFFLYMNYLEQICELKTLESKILYIFKDDIEYENKNSSISALSAIENATNILYVMCQTPYAFKGKNTLKKEIAKFSKFIKDSNKMNDENKRTLISKYSNLPLILYEDILGNMMDDDYDKLDEFCDTVNDTISGILENNYNIVEQLKQISESKGVYSDEEEEPYERNDNYLDPAIK